MSELLTLEEYQAIAANLDFPTNAYIDGKFTPSKSGNTFTSTNPATGEVLGEVAACNSDDVDFAVSKARECFERGDWRTMHPAARKQVLIKLAKLIKRNRHELAVLESLDSGKPIRDCATIDIPETIHCLTWHAETIDKMYDQTAPVGEDAMAMIVREPIGVVGCVLPWNFPLLMLAWKIAPALAAGNSVIVKPAEQTSLSTLKLAELAITAGIPRGAFNVLTGDGEGVGQPLGLHPDVDMISFTGSTDTGRRFLRYAADSNMKEIVLECGGKNPAIVMDDAEDLDLVAEHLVSAAFWNMGENCSAASRLIVHEKVKQPLLDLIAKRLQQWRIGNPLDPKNQLGAMIDKEHFAKVSSYLDADNIIIGGNTSEGCYIEPTVIDKVSTDSRWANEEIFSSRYFLLLRLIHWSKRLPLPMQLIMDWLPVFLPPMPNGH